MKIKSLIPISFLALFCQFAIGGGWSNYPNYLLTTGGTINGDLTITGLTASLPVFTNGSKKLVSNAMTGTGSVVMSTDATLVTPALGTPTALVGTNITGTAAGLTAGTVTTNANLTGPITSVGNATSIASQTGIGSKFVVDTSPTLVTPNLGTPTALVGTNITGTASGLTAGSVTTNANLTGPITSVGNATSIASQTGAGTTFAMSAGPAFTGTVAGAAGTFTGKFGIIAAPGSNDQFAINGTSTLSATTQRAMNLAYTGTANATVQITGIRAALTGASATTVTDVVNFQGNPAVAGGSGGAITRFTSYLEAGAAAHTATNNASFSDNQLFTGNWFINQSGTDASTLGGALNVAGAVTLPGLASSSAATTGTLCWTTGTGNVNVDTTTTCLLSTRRIKEFIEPIDSGLETVMKLRPVSYQLKKENNPAHLGRQVGFISEEVAEIDDRLISRDANGDPMGVRYQQLTAVLTKAIQEQALQIAELKQEMKKIKGAR